MENLVHDLPFAIDFEKREHVMLAKACVTGWATKPPFFNCRLLIDSER
jgi:hypothetical protein